MSNTAVKPRGDFLLVRGEKKKELPAMQKVAW
jgi:hypothetical protein